MIELQNSDIVKKVIQSLIIVTKKKTSERYSIVLMNYLKENLQKEYVFYKYISFVSKTFDHNTIQFKSDINLIDPLDIGGGIQALVDIFYKELGKKAGYFIIREFRDTLGEHYHTAIKEIGVDLRLTELQNELYNWSSNDYEIKDKADSNVAYIEKKS